jgi:hypothetical protein
VAIWITNGVQKSSVIAHAAHVKLARNVGTGELVETDPFGCHFRVNISQGLPSSICVPNSMKAPKATGVRYLVLAQHDMQLALNVSRAQGHDSNPEFRSQEVPQAHNAPPLCVAVAVSSIRPKLNSRLVRYAGRLPHSGLALRLQQLVLHEHRIDGFP